MFARYLELLATVQYVNARVHVFGSEENAFFLGSILPNMLVLTHFFALIAIVQFLDGTFGLPAQVLIALRVGCVGLLLAVLAFLATNDAYLKNIRDRFRTDSLLAASQRERDSWRFVVASLLSFPASLFVFIIYAT